MFKIKIIEILPLIYIQTYHSTKSYNIVIFSLLNLNFHSK